MGEDNAQSSFMARAHNELYAFYTGKGDITVPQSKSLRRRWRVVVFCL